MGEFEMRSSTPEEQELFNAMLERNSTALVSETDLIELREENEKLRKLCSMLYSDICDTDEWFKGRGMDDLHAPAYRRLIEELGIEVTDEHMNLQVEWDWTEIMNERLNEENKGLRELVEDLLLIPMIRSYDCYGCKYDEFADCDMHSKCMLLERAKVFGIVRDFIYE